MIIRFLGTHNAESRDSRLASLLIDGVLALDAGSLTSELSLDEQDKIKAVLLSHGHYDHIRDIPALAFNNSHRTTRVLATPETLEVLASHLLDGVIYPKFIEKLLQKGIKKFIAQEVSVDLCKENYGGHFEAVKNDVKETDDLRVLDYNGHHIFSVIPFSEMGEPFRYEG